MITITKADQFCGPKMFSNSVLKFLNHEYLTFTQEIFKLQTSKETIPKFFIYQQQ